MRTKRRERYSRNLEGLNAQGFFSNSTIGNGGLAAAATLPAFLVSGEKGQVGFYLADGTQAIVTGAPPADDADLRICQRIDNPEASGVAAIKPSYLFNFGEIVNVQKTGYVAPVIQETFVGYNGTDGDLNITIVGGLQEFVCSVRLTTPANQPFPVQEGRAIVRFGTPTDYDIATQIVADMLSFYDYEDNADVGFIRATVITDVAGGAPITGTNVMLTEGQRNIVSDAPVVTPVVDGYVIIDGGTYKVTEVQGNTVFLDRPYEGPTQVVAAASVLTAAPGAVTDTTLVGIRLRGYDETVIFETTVAEDLLAATITESVEWIQGSGAAWQVASMEDESSVFDGWTTNNEAWPVDFGKPEFFVDDVSADQYALYFMTLDKRAIPSAGAPQNQTKMRSYVIIAAIEGSALETDLDLLFTGQPGFTP